MDTAYGSYYRYTYTCSFRRNAWKFEKIQKPAEEMPGNSRKFWGHPIPQLRSYFRQTKPRRGPEGREKEQKLVIRILSRHDRRAGVMIHHVEDDGFEIVRVVVPENADYTAVADEFGKGNFALAMVSAFTEDEG